MSHDVYPTGDGQKVDVIRRAITSELAAHVEPQRVMLRPDAVKERVRAIPLSIPVEDRFSRISDKAVGGGLYGLTKQECHTL